MPKLTVTQCNVILKNLKAVASTTLAQVEVELKAALVPPKVTKRELKKYLVRQVYDHPMNLVSQLLEHPTSWPLEKKRLAERDDGFTQFNEVMSSLRVLVADLLNKVEIELHFKDDWGTEYPSFLEDDLIESITDALKGDTNDN